MQMAARKFKNDPNRWTVFERERKERTNEDKSEKVIRFDSRISIFRQLSVPMPEANSNNVVTRKENYKQCLSKLVLT